MAGRQRQPGIPAPLLFFGLVICIGCGWLGLQVAGPLQQAARLHGENDAIERELHRADIRNQDSLKEIKAAGTDEGAVIAARAKGYMFPNERPLHIQTEGAAQPAPTH